MINFSLAEFEKFKNASLYKTFFSEGEVPFVKNKGNRSCFEIGCTLVSNSGEKISYIYEDEVFNFGEFSVFIEVTGRKEKKIFLEVKSNNIKRLYFPASAERIVNKFLDVRVRKDFVIENGMPVFKLKKPLTTIDGEIIFYFFEDVDLVVGDMIPVFVRVKNRDKVVNGTVVFNRILEFSFDEGI